MADTDFYSRNLRRWYPLEDEGVPAILPGSYTDTTIRRLKSAVVDFGVVLLPSSGFDLSNALHNVFFVVTGPYQAITLLFWAPDTALHNRQIAITPTTAGKFSKETFVVTDTDGLVHGFGFIVFGDDIGDNTYNLLWDIASSPSEYRAVESRCIQVVDGHYVNKFVVANEPRTTADYWLEQSSSSVIGNDSSSTYIIAPGGDEVIGDVKFREGYNCDIDVISRNNTIRFIARRGAGLGVACDEIPRTWTERELQAEGIYLDRAARCHEAITHINGISPDNDGNFRLEEGRDVEITNPSAFTVRIAGRESMEDCET